MTKIKDSVIWITGASSGIGEEMTYQFSKLGAKLIISARREAILEEVRSKCHNPELIKVLPLDLSQIDSLPQKAKEAQNLFGKIDILVNNGGISLRDFALNTKIEVDKQLMDVNYFAPILLSKEVAHHQIQNHGGHHVVISSAVGIISTPYRSSYAASKHALHGFYDAFRAENHDKKIKVTIICPGFVNTLISVNSLKGDGSKNNIKDKAQLNGLSVDKCVKSIINSIEKDKEEVYIGGLKEVLGIYIKRFIPSLFSILARKVKVI